MDELYAAIDSNQDQEKIKILIKERSANQINDFLRSKRNDVTMLEFVFTSRSKEIGFILLSKSQQKYADDNNAFNWLKIFDLLEDFVLAKTHKKIRSKRIASKVKFLSRFSKEIDVRSLITRPKFFATAFLLGAKFVPTSQSDSMFTFVFKSELKRYAKRALIAWLLDNKFINNKSVPVELFAEIIKKGSLYIPEAFLKHYPGMLEDTDDQGRNVMHFCLPNTKTVRFGMFKRCMDFVSSHTSDEQIYHILTTRSNQNIVPATAIVQKGLAISRFFIPIQVMNTLTKLAREGKQTVLEQLYHGSASFYKNYVLKAYLIQCGMKMDVAHFTSRSDVKDLSQVLWFVEPSKISKTAKQSRQKFEASKQPINKASTSKLSPTLPTEILLLIALDLKPTDLGRFSMSCKLMKDFIENKASEVFWKEYYDRNYKNNSAWNQTGLSYKTKFVHETKGQSNWRKNKFTSIVIDKCEPVLMDENWLVLRSPSSLNYHYWNCHTHQVTNIERTPPPRHYLKPLAMLGTYASLPSIIYTKQPYGQGVANFGILTGETNVVPKNANERFEFKSARSVKTIDHRILINSEAIMYDVETDQFIGKEDNFVVHAGVCVNPYNRTFTKKNWQGNLQIYNYQYELMQTIPNNSRFDYSVLEAVDEYTLFFQEYSYYSPNGFIDLRTGKGLWTEDHFLPTHHTHLDYASSSTRIVVKGPNTELLGSFHLPSQKFEWIHPGGSNSSQSITPVAINSRYLASRESYKTILYDFCADL